MILSVMLVLAQAALPEMLVEATDGGSALLIKNTHRTQAMAAYLVELVDYPGSTFAFSQDELAMGGRPFAAGEQRRVPIGNMTVGAASDYVKLRAALYADGSSSGEPEKVAQLVARRKMLAETIRGILATPGGLKAMLEATPAPGRKVSRSAPEAVDATVKRALIREAMDLPQAQMVATFRARLKALEK